MDGTAIGIAVQKSRQDMAEKIIVDIQNYVARFFKELDQW